MHRVTAETLQTAAPLRLLSGPAQIRRIVLVGSFPPRRCGIATFTADVRNALLAAAPQAAVDVVAMTDEGGTYAYGEEVMFAIRQDHLEDYAEAARRIDALQPDVVCVQHEFGLFGGPAGEHLMALLDLVQAPVIATVHTVLSHPTEDQRRVFARLLRRASKIIVMAQRGHDMLRDLWSVPPRKLAVVPHGAPDRPLVDTAGPKRSLGLEGREVLLTFGLLSPGKGLETAIRALPDIVRARPDALYVVLGATHPHLLAREGEVYREGLAALAEALGVTAHIRFENRYVDTPHLLEWLAAADIYLTPYPNEAQITSGTLSYAVALGKAVISTPYWHAQELLAAGRGVLTPFRDAGAIARAAITLLSRPDDMAEMRRRAWEKGRDTVWSRLAESYLEVVGEVRRATPRRAELQADGATPRPAMGGLRRMTDACGLLQHSTYGVPDRNHGYCVDDNARALLLTHRLRTAGVPAQDLDDLATTYAAFVHHAWNPAVGRFRNFMSYDRRWLEERGSDDSGARAYWAAAVTASEAPSQAMRRWAHELCEAAGKHLDGFTALRTYAFLILGLSSLVRGDPTLAHERDLLERLAKGLASALSDEADWRWFEPFLTYDNARLPEALLRAGQVLDDAALIKAGLDALDWLCGRQTGPGGVFRAVGTDNFGRLNSTAAPFDQQPLEAAATVDACAAAFAATGDVRWLSEARRAFDWFGGRNELGVPLADPETGECYDGLTPTGPNLNRGAESILSFQLAVCAMHALERLAQPGPRPADTASPEGRPVDRCPSSITANSDSRPIRNASSFGPSTSLQTPDR